MKSEEGVSRKSFSARERESSAVSSLRFKGFPNFPPELSVRTDLSESGKSSSAERSGTLRRKKRPSARCGEHRRREVGWYRGEDSSHVCFTHGIFLLSEEKSFRRRRGMKERLQNLLSEGERKIMEAKSENDLQSVKNKFLGKQGTLTELLKELPTLDIALRPEMGRLVNQAKSRLTELVESRREEIKLKASEVSSDFDCSVPGIMPPGGGLHPITQMCYDLNDAFRSMGFEIYQEDDITSELYAFDKLNFPPNHPARESMDTYWLEGHDSGATNEKLCLRPHLTGGSVRYLQTHKAPYRFVYPGRVYRNETTDAHHERAFFQYEALIVDKDITFTAGKVMIRSILSKVFGRDVPVRMRAGFFPFVEPGFEIDMECQVCGGKGCSVCKHVGWIEVMPGGTPHPNVLRAAGLDPDEYTGFYVNIGLDRLVMMRYGVDDVRLFHSADLRFLKQFC